MNAVSELRQDLEELKRLLSLASRSNVRNILAIEIGRLEEQLGSQSARPSADIKVPSETSSLPPLPTKKLVTYAWDQSEQLLKLYVTIADIQTVSPDQVTVVTTEKKIDLTVKDCKGTNYTFTVSGFLHPIVPSESSHKIKKDMILLLLRKKDVGKHWECVTAEEGKSKEKQKSKFDKMEQNEDPSMSLMTMMQQMYDDGDDEMKRTIKKAWYESEQKKRSGDYGAGSMDL